MREKKMSDKYKPRPDIDPVTVGSVKGDKQPIKQPASPQKPKIILPNKNRKP